MSYFQFPDPSRAVIMGGFTAANAGEIHTGVLVVSSATNTLTLAGSSSKPDGFALTNRLLVPNALRTTEYADADETVSVVNGKVLVWADASFFYGGTLPSINDTVYVGNSGLMATSGTVKLGKVSKSADYRTPPNSTTDIVFLDLELGGLDAV